MAAEAGAMSSPAPPKDLTTDQQLQWYKSQYESIAEELRDYMETSKDVEASLEQELETAETNQRSLREKYESLGFEVDEWRVRIASHGIVWPCVCIYARV
jgi:chromosome segregation ATPase